tara:strand:+ start:307 stop:504 length:198 start_codon:yes stop_codon:yes gene_type:complete
MNKIKTTLKLVGYSLIVYSLLELGNITHLCDECLFENIYTIIKVKKAGVFGLITLLVVELLNLKK